MNLDSLTKPQKDFHKEKGCPELMLGEDDGKCCEGCFFDDDEIECCCTDECGCSKIFKLKETIIPPVILTPDRFKEILLEVLDLGMNTRDLQLNHRYTESGVAVLDTYMNKLKELV